MPNPKIDYRKRDVQKRTPLRERLRARLKQIASLVMPKFEHRLGNVYELAPDNKRQWYFMAAAALLFFFVCATSVWYISKDFSSSSSDQATDQVREAGPFEDATDEEAFIYDISSWSNRDLAAQMLIVITPSYEPGTLYSLAEQGIGGVVLSSDYPVGDLGDHIKSAQDTVPHGIKMFISSDEEGGTLLRLQTLLGHFPSHATMGSWSSHQITDEVFRYGQLLVGLGINLALGPVADLKVEGSYMTLEERTFAHDPSDVARCVIAWQKGMHQAGVAVAPKHWPGMGSANDTHLFSSTIAPLESLINHDMVPFEAAWTHGAEMIMVAHVISSGLTQEGVPATVSPSALTYLRQQAGDRVVIITDAMDMGGVIDYLGVDVNEAVIQSAVAGADVVMSTIETEGTIQALTYALDTGRLPREQAEASVMRILALKEKMGLSTYR